MLAQMGQTKTLSILLVERDPHFRAELRALLSGNYTIVGETSSAETAISLIAQRHPDLMLLGKIKGSNEIAVLQQLQEKPEKVKPLVLSAHQEGSEILRALQAGAKGYVFTSQVDKQLEEAITIVSQGDVFLPPKVATLLSQWLRAINPTSNTLTETPQLSNRQLEVLELLVRGHSTNEAIAKRLHIEIGTVKAHLTNIQDKLQVEHNRIQTVVKAIKLGLIQP